MPPRSENHDSAVAIASNAQIRRTAFARAREEPSLFNGLVLRDERTGGPIKNAPMHLEWHRLINNHDRLVCTAAVDSGKLLPLDTPIPTPGGWCANGDLQAGDVVFARSGSACRVTWAGPVEVDQPAYRLTFDDGATLVAGAEHRWLAKTIGDAVDGWRVVTTQQMLDAGVTAHDDYQWRIPLAAPVEYPERSYTTDPYVLGVWLALGLLNDKHVPGDYLLGSVSQRRELLAGLLDTDGCVDRSYIEFTSTDEPIAQGCLELARSLGYKATIAEGRATLRGVDMGPKWRVCFTAHDPVFWSPRKRAMHRVGPVPALGARTTYRCVVAIDPVPSVPMRCIAVDPADSPDCTYLAGHDYVVTHNTVQVSVGRVLWEIGRNPNIRVAVITKTARLAQTIIRAQADYIARSESLHEVFPGLVRNPNPKMPWNITALTVDRTVFAKDATVQACGVFGNIHGTRIDLLVLDDVIDSENTRTQVPRDHLWNWVRATLMGRLSGAGARVIVLANAFHPDDLAHRLAREPGFTSHKFPVVDERGDALWPEHWPPARIAKARQDMGPFEFARALLCQARDDDSMRFKREWIDACCARGTGLRCCRTADDLYNELLEVHPDWVDDALTAESVRLLGDHSVQGYLDAIAFYTGVDLAFSKRDSADMTCVFTIAVFPNGDRRVMEVEAGRWDAPETLIKIESAHARFKSIVMVESVGAQRGMLDILTGRSAIPVVPHNTGSSASSRLEFIIEAIAVEMMNSKWIIPSGAEGKQRDREIDAWLSDLYAYDPARHTPDRVAAMCFARECSRLHDSRAGGNVGVRTIGGGQPQAKAVGGDVAPGSTCAHGRRARGVGGERCMDCGEVLQ